MLDAYRMEDAEVAVILLNSAAETAKEAADQLREQGHRVGVLSLNVLRPFPAQSIREALSGVKAAVVGDRADSYGADGGNLSLEVRAAIRVPRRLQNGAEVFDLLGPRVLHRLIEGDRLER